MAEAVYTAKAVSTGGGRDGHVATDDRTIDMDVRPPKELGGSGEGTNPEQLVGAGWAACFNGALQAIMGKEGVKTEKSPEVRVETTLNKVEEGFQISAKIDAVIFGVDQAQADDLVKKAHAFCPYSKAMQNNIEVDVSAEAK